MVNNMLIGVTCKPDEYIDVSRAGFDYIEFPCRNICEMDEDEFIALCKTVNNIGFPVMGMNIYCPPEIIIAGPGYDPDITRSYAKKAADRGYALGVKVIGIGSPRSRVIPEGFDLKLAKNQLMEFITITAKEFGVFNITLAFEALAPCYCNFINTLADAYEVVSKIDITNIKIVVDFYNMEHSGEADIDINGFIDRIFHAHISDDDGAPTLRSYLDPEKYPIHRERLYRLKESGYTGALTIETDVPYNEFRAKDNLNFLKSLGSATF